MILMKIRINRYWSFHLGLFTWEHLLSNIQRLFFEAFIIYYNTFFQSMFITMMYPPKGFIFITIDLLFIDLNFIYLLLICIWMILKHYILLFQRHFICFYTKDKISVFRIQTQQNIWGALDAWEVRGKSYVSINPSCVKKRSWKHFKNRFS